MQFLTSQIYAITGAMVEYKHDPSVNFWSSYTDLTVMKTLSCSVRARFWLLKILNSKNVSKQLARSLEFHTLTTNIYRKWQNVSHIITVKSWTNEKNIICRTMLPLTLYIQNTCIGSNCWVWQGACDLTRQILLTQWPSSGTYPVRYLLKNKYHQYETLHWMPRNGADRWTDMTWSWLHIHWVRRPDNVSLWLLNNSLIGSITNTKQQIHTLLLNIVWPLFCACCDVNNCK